MGLPNLSPEEEYLLKKFALLKKKRKAIQKSKEKAETTTQVKPGLKREAQDSPHAPEDAKEIAKKLIASGEVKIKKDPVHREFKRLKSSTDRRHSKEGQVAQHSPSARSEQSKAAMKNLFESCFVKEGQNRRFSGGTGFSDDRNDEPRKGNTIFVGGYHLTEDILKKAFDRFGKVERTKFEKEKRHGFITFDTCEAADKAIKEMNGSMFSGVHLKVDLARRQPSAEDSRSHPKTWVSRDARGPSQSSETETETVNRTVVTYDDLF